MLEYNLKIVFVFSCQVVDIELVWVVCKVLIVILVLFLWLVSSLSSSGILWLVLFEIIGVRAWFFLRDMNWFLWLFHFICFIIFLLLLIILMARRLILLLFFMMATTIVRNINVAINFFFILPLLIFCFYFLLWLFCSICQPSQEVYSFCVT